MYLVFQRKPVKFQYHIAFKYADSYLVSFRYFTRTVLQFQFVEALCNIADPGTPLHKCDFSGSKEAGKALAEMLKLGSSLPWPDALEKLTGTREMSVKPLLSFFKPLRKWLEETNAANRDQPGWSIRSRRQIAGPILGPFPNLELPITPSLPDLGTIPRILGFNLSVPIMQIAEMFTTERPSRSRRQAVPVLGDLFPRIFAINISIPFPQLLELFSSDEEENKKRMVTLKNRNIQLKLKLF